MNFKELNEKYNTDENYKKMIDEDFNQPVARLTEELYDLDLIRGNLVYFRLDGFHDKLIKKYESLGLVEYPNVDLHNDGNMWKVLGIK